MGKPGLFLFMDRDAEIGIECFGIFLCIARFKGVDAAGFVNSEFVIIHGVSAFCRTDGHPSRFVKRRIGAYSHQNDVVMKSLGRLGSSVKEKTGSQASFPLFEHPAIHFSLDEPIGLVPWSAQGHPPIPEDGEVRLLRRRHRQ